MSLLEIHTSAFGDGGHCQEDYPVSDLFHYAYDDPAKWLRAHNYYRACHGAPPPGPQPGAALPQPGPTPY